MERIKLSKEQKALLIKLAKSPLNDMRDKIPFEVYSLERLGLTEKTYNKGMIYRLTEDGKRYIAQNPELKNPFPWEWVMRGITIATLIAAVAALFVGCMRLLAA